MSSERVRFFKSESDGWFAECLICCGWVGRGDGTRRSAEERFGRHLQNDHQRGDRVAGAEIGQAPSRQRSHDKPGAEQVVSDLLKQEVSLGPDVRVSWGPTLCPRCGSEDIVWFFGIQPQVPLAEVHTALQDRVTLADTYVCRTCHAGWIEPDQPEPITWVRPFRGPTEADGSVRPGIP